MVILSIYSFHNWQEDHGKVSAGELPQLKGSKEEVWEFVTEGTFVKLSGDNH